MNNLQLICSISLLAASLPAMASQAFSPYLGVDIKQNTMPFEENVGNGQVQSHYPQGNFFMGIKLYGYLAVEAGYESTVRKSKSTFTPLGESFLGVESVGYLSEIRTKIAGPHINIVGFYPLFEEGCINLFGSLGLAKLSFKSHLDVSIPPDPDLVAQNFPYVKKKVLPRVTLGVEHLITCHLGIRATMTWEETSAFGSIYGAEGATTYMRPKNSTSLGMGVFYRF